MRWFASEATRIKLRVDRSSSVNPYWGERLFQFVAS